MFLTEICRKLYPGTNKNVGQFVVSTTMKKAVTIIVLYAGLSCRRNEFQMAPASSSSSATHICTAIEHAQIKVDSSPVIAFYSARVYNSDAVYCWPRRHFRLRQISYSFKAISIHYFLLSLYITIVFEGARSSAGGTARAGLLQKEKAEKKQNGRNFGKYSPPSSNVTEQRHP
jgi:hypothetical protein